jgi:2-hydroxy-6-oxonona-2,4-dienedioate hydrolase
MSNSPVNASQPSVIAYPVEAAGRLTRVLQCGTGDDTVVFLHGSGARADRWRHNLTAVAEGGRRALAFDFPGHGFASKGPAQDYGVGSFAEVLAGVVADLCDRPVSLVGTSLGAHVAAWYACSSPASVKSVVLIGPLGVVPVDRDPAATSARIADTSVAGIVEKLRLLMCDHSLITPEWVEEERRVNTSPGAEAALGQLRTYLANVNDDVVGEQYGRLGIPTLLVWGAEDRFVEARYGLEAQKMIGAPLVYLDGTGHIPYLERYETFNRLLGEFLANPAAVPDGVHHR